MTLLSDHGTKLDSRQVADILSRVMLINAMRMLPVSQKGFCFLTKLKVHMKSYRAPIESVNSERETHSNYPSRVYPAGSVVHPRDSYFDKVGSKRKLPASLRERSDVGTDGHYRKHHRPF